MKAIEPSYYLVSPKSVHLSRSAWTGSPAETAFVPARRLRRFMAGAGCDYRRFRLGTHMSNLPTARVLYSGRHRTESPRQLACRIAESRTLLQLQHDWDGEGSEPINEDTWKRAVDFLQKQATLVRSRSGLEIDAPDILPGPDASIDLHWDRKDFELLVNIPADPKKMAGFYGDDRGVIRQKGTFDPSRLNEALLAWFVKPR